MFNLEILCFRIIEKFQRDAAKEEEKKKAQEKNGVSQGVTNLAFNGGTEKSQNTYL